MRYQIIPRSLIPEHKALKGQMQLLTELAVDFEAALFILRQDNRTPEQWRTLTLKMGSLSQAINSFADGIRNHCRHEEALLRPLLCQVLVKGLFQEHREIESHAVKAKLPLTQLGSSLPKNSERPLPETRWLLAKGHEVKRAICDTCQMVEAHIAREDSLWQMLEKGLELDSQQDA